MVSSQCTKAPPKRLTPSCECTRCHTLEPSAPCSFESLERQQPRCCRRVQPEVHSLHTGSLPFQERVCGTLHRRLSPCASRWRCCRRQRGIMRRSLECSRGEVCAGGGESRRRRDRTRRDYSHLLRGEQLRPRRRQVESRRCLRRHQRYQGGGQHQRRQPGHRSSEWDWADDGAGDEAT